MLSKDSSGREPEEIVPKRALLIGAEIDGLAGVENDLNSMAQALEARDFAIGRCTGKDATRAGILAAYEALIAAAGPRDAVVVYYSGHGGFVRPPDAGLTRSELMDMQFIAPVDFYDSTDDDFRGVTSVELSVLLGRLTEKTRNATVVLDCCHAAQMSRDLRLVVKSLRNLAPYERLRAHIDKLRGDGVLHTELRRPTGNPYAVRIVACAPEQSAFEYEGRDGKRVGVLTESLTMALAEAGFEKITWATVMDRVRQRVLRRSPNQRPEVEGPSRRLLFDTAEDLLLATLRATAIGSGRVSLAGAPLLGVQHDDAFVIMPPGAVGPDHQLKVGDLRVDRVGPFAAEGHVTFNSGWTQVPVGARAHRTTIVAQALPVCLPDSDGVAADLVKAVAADLNKAVAAEPLLRRAVQDEDWLAEVRLGPTGGLTLHDRIGPLRTPCDGDRDGIEQIVHDLKILAQATGVRGLAAKSEWAFNADVAVEWGHVRQGRKIPLKAPGSVVHVGDRIYVSVRNNTGTPVFVSLVDIGVSGRIGVLTRFSPAGVQLAPNERYTLGFDDLDGELTGVPLSWPTGLDPAQARPETVLVIVTSGPQDISALEQDGVGRRGVRGPVSPLQRLLDQVATGCTRELDPPGGPSVRFDVHTIEFELRPLADEGPFLIDERPDPATLLRTSRGAAPMTVAVRIEELQIHHNRALFGADIRVDAVVLTGAGPTVQPVYLAQTERFSNIRDNERLPLDRALVYHGPAVSYLDLAVWVSRDEAGSLALSDLLADELTGLEVQNALVTLSGTMLTSAHAATAAVVMGAGAVVINVAYRLLRGAVGNVIGLYRGSLLAHERFGVGRHPETGVRRVQDFSIAYTVEDVT